MHLRLLVFKLLLNEHKVLEILDEFHLLKEVSLTSLNINEVLVELCSNELAACVLAVRL